MIAEQMMADLVIPYVLQQPNEAQLVLESLSTHDEPPRYHIFRFQDTLWQAAEVIAAKQTEQIFRFELAKVQVLQPLLIALLGERLLHFAQLALILLSPGDAEL